MEGYSNFLWMLIVSAGLKLGATAINTAQFVSLMAQFLTVLMVYRLGVRPDRPAFAALLAPLFLAGQVAFLSYPMTGLETTFYTALVTGAVLLYHRQHHLTLGGAAAIAAILFGVSLTRIDGLVLAFILIGARLLADGDWKGTLRAWWPCSWSASWSTTRGGSVTSPSRCPTPSTPSSGSPYPASQLILQDSINARRTAAALLLLVFALSLVPLYRGRAFTNLSNRYFRSQDVLALGRHLDTVLEPDDVVALEWVGIAPSAMRQPVLDTFGLTDYDIARQEDFKRSVYGRWITFDYLASRRPDVVASCVRLYSTREEARRNLEPGGRCRYRFYPDLVGPEHGYDLHVFRVREDAFWPAIVRGEVRARLEGQL